MGKYTYNGKSEFQNKKRIKKQQGHDTFTDCSDDTFLEQNATSTILIMLDIGGTVDEINPVKAKKFVQLLNLIKRQYKADNLEICISTHDHSPKRIPWLIKELTPFLKKDNYIGTCFYMDGIYDVKTNQHKEVTPLYNYQKIDPFLQHYFIFNTNSKHIKWVGVMDDSINIESISKLQNSCPVTIFKPSQISEEKDTFMCYNTTTYGFDGTLETLQKHYSNLLKFGYKKLFDEQKRYLRPFSYSIFWEILEQKDYTLLLRYIYDDNLDDSWYLIFHKYISKIEDSNNENLNTIKEIIENRLNNSSLQKILKI